MSRIIIRKITSITSIITPRDSRSQVWSASSTVPVAIDTLAYKTLDGNGSFEKRGNNRRNKILDSILLAAGEKEKILPRWIFALFESQVLLRWMEMIDRVTAYSPPFIARSSIRISSYPWLESLAYREPTIVSKYIGASLRIFSPVEKADRINLERNNALNFINLMNLGAVRGEENL